MVLGLTQASSVIADDNCSDDEFGMFTRAFVPLNDSAPPYFPAVDQAVFATVPLLPLPDASPTAVPAPSSNEYAATSPVAAAPATGPPAPAQASSVQPAASHTAMR